MTREEARKAAEVMLAYANGEQIECKYKEERSWYLRDNPAFEWYSFDYRVKPKTNPKYRAFKDAEECWNEMQKHQPFGWIKSKEDNTMCVIVAMEDDVTKIVKYEGGGCVSYEYNTMFRVCEFVDGTPLGIKMEE